VILARRRVSLSLAVAGLLAFGSVECQRASDAADLLPPRDFRPPPVRPLVPNAPGVEKLGFFGGFYPPDVLGDGRTWHWMGRSGEVRLRSDGAKHRLRLVCSVPLAFLNASPTIDITLDGRLVERFVAKTKMLHKEYLLQPEGLGTSAVLRFETSALAHVPGDSRELGLSIQELDWEAAD
jgi:hypothetical protein